MPIGIYERPIRKLIIKDDHSLIPLTQGQIGIIGLEDVKKAAHFNWCAVWKKNAQTFYAMGWVNGKRIYLHRFIMDITDPKIQIDHRDHDGLNCRRKNMRICTSSQNQMNKRINYNSSSQYKGVSWYKRYNKWSVQIGFKNKKFLLGYYNNEKEAAAIYNKAAIKYFGEFANLNRFVRKGI